MILRHGSPEEVGVSEARTQNVRSIAKRWVEEGIHPSLVVLAARQGVIFLHEAYGQLGPEDGASAVELNTIFPIVSISKPITATVAMILVEEGLLGLNRPVREYIPEFGGEGKHQVLIRQLLTHTSGLETKALVEQAADEGIDLEEANLAPWISENLDDYMALIYRTPLSKPPDSEMVYDNLNYDLLGEIVNRVAGKGLAVLAEDRIFKPLGMEDTFFVVPMEVKDRVVRRPKSAVFYDFTRVFMDAELGSSGAYSTAMDMAIFGQMFLNGGIFGGDRTKGVVVCLCCDCCCDVRLGLRMGTDAFKKKVIRPEGVSVVVSDDCQLCGDCAEPEVCSVRAIHLGPEKSIIHLDLCVGCGKCIGVCPDQAISFVFDPELDIVGSLISQVESYTDIT